MGCAHFLLGRLAVACGPVRAFATPACRMDVGWRTNELVEGRLSGREGGNAGESWGSSSPSVFLRSKHLTSHPGQTKNFATTHASHVFVKLRESPTHRLGLFPHSRYTQRAFCRSTHIRTGTGTGKDTGTGTGTDTDTQTPKEPMPRDSPRNAWCLRLKPKP